MVVSKSDEVTMIFTRRKKQLVSKEKHKTAQQTHEGERRFA